LRQKRGVGTLIFDGVNNLGLFAVLLVTIYPFLHVAATSISDSYAVLQNKVTFYPVGWNFSAYRAVFDNPALWTSYRNTILYTTVGTLINLSLTTLMAYALSKPRLYGRKIFTVIVIVTMFFQGGMIPSYIIVNKLELINTMWAVILPTAISTWNLIIMRTFFQGFPQDLEEAGIMDGANPVQILLRIVMPLSKPILATMTLYYAVGHWNSYMQPLLYLNEKVKYPLQILLQQILISGDTSFADASSVINAGEVLIGQSVKYATIIVAILPIILVYPFIQKYFVKGAMMGSIKG
jgi:putative aldouronate transport system permease protein